MRTKLFTYAMMISAGLITTGCNKTASEGEKNPAFAAIDAKYLESGGDGSNWAAPGFSSNEQRFSPLDKINNSNVGELGIAWFADLPDARGHESTPVVVDGKMFVTGPWSKVFAFDQGPVTNILPSTTTGVDS